MAYRRDSDYVMPYAAFTPIPLGNRKEGDVWTEQQVRDKISKKSKFIVWFVRKCSTFSARELYVRELKKYVQLDEFGKCSGKRCDRDCESKRIDDYKFVIAMENSVCRDYVTEKFWRVDRLVVPIVLRSSDYLLIAPNNSFIAVDQFENVQRLAEHLQMLNENEDEYLKYFDWTKYYLKFTFSELPMCELCAKLLEKPRPFKQYDSNSWNAPGVCETGFINKFIK